MAKSNRRRISRNARVVRYSDGRVVLKNNPNLSVTIEDKGNKKGHQVTIECDGNRYTIDHNVRGLYLSLKKFFESSEDSDESAT